MKFFTAMVAMIGLILLFSFINISIAYSLWHPYSSSPLWYRFIFLGVIAFLLGWYIGEFICWNYSLFKK